MYRIKSIWVCCSANLREYGPLDYGAEQIAQQTVQASRRVRGKGNKSPARADARILPFAADVAAPGARGGDAAFPRLAAQLRPDRTAMADFARARFGRYSRGHGARPRRFSARSKPLPNPARPGSASPDRAPGCESRPAPRRAVDFGQGNKTDRGGRAVVGSDLRRNHPALRRAQACRGAGDAACAREKAV